ncbi:thyrotropin-releasing hormone receptor-like [Tubulanus polymorphus]|uniref:thyrotropin-releasing hormone receptor-like n=1 Tax=Tubulanus polymorphus TaxID=672921 RepID=UPI003DA43150
MNPIDIVVQLFGFLTFVSCGDAATRKPSVVYSNDGIDNRSNATINCPVIADIPEFRQIYVYGLPIIIIIGTIGNTISLIVLCQRTMRQTGTYFYMAILAVADTAVLYLNGLRKWIYFLTGFDLNQVSDAGCKTMSFVNYWTFDFATWILVAMTVDRFLAVHSPLRAIQLSTISRIKKVLLLLAVIDVGLNMHLFWTMELLVNPCGKYCIPRREFSNFHHRVWPIVDAVFYSFVPFLMLLVFNIIIVQDMFVAWRVRRNLYANSNNDIDLQNVATTNRRSNKQRNHITTSSWHLTLMLLVVTTIFLVLSAPNCIYMIVRMVTDVTTREQRRRVKITKAATTLLLYVNHCVNFYLYCASGRKFRQTLVSIYKYARERRRMSATASVTQNTRVSFSSLTGRISMVSEHSQT